MSSQQKQLPFLEFVLLIASMISIVALAIDAMLPALPSMGDDLGVATPNDRQLIISVLLLGMGVGQIILSPLSDSTGRKPAILLGFFLFSLGCVLSIYATTFSAMLAGRFLQGLGAAGPRSVTMALVRDGYRGRELAKVMSFMMSVFILVPALAPTIGQALLLWSGWRSIFVAFLVMAVAISIWFYLRQPETLAPNARSRLSLRKFKGDALEVLKHPLSLGYAITAGLIFGAFLGYLNSSQQLFQDMYRVGDRFPLYFAVLALAIGGASLVNTRLLNHWRMDKLSRAALIGIVLWSLLFLGWIMLYSGNPPFIHMMVYFMVNLFAIGILFGNVNAIAMEPMGHIAGVGAAVIGSVSTLVSVPIGILIGRLFNQTLYPLVAGFIILSLLSLLVIRFIDHSSLEDES